MNDLFHFFSDTRERCIHQGSFGFGVWFGLMIHAGVFYFFSYNPVLFIAFMFYGLVARLFWYLSPVR